MGGRPPRRVIASLAVKSAPLILPLAVLFLVNVLNFYDRNVTGALAEPMKAEFALTDRDIGYARQLGYVIKLVALARDSSEGVEVRVHPAMLPLAHPLASVNDVFNAVYVRGNAVGEVMFYGRGAGSLPTGSSVADGNSVGGSACTGSTFSDFSIASASSAGVAGATAKVFSIAIGRSWSASVEAFSDRPPITD